MNDSLQNMAKFLVKATGAVYSECTTQLLPTPSKSHYVFNLRDFGRVVQGMMQMNKNLIEIPEDINTDDGEGEGQSTHGGSKRDKGGPKKMVRLWAHEVLRVFSDRLISETDREICLQILKGSAGAHLLNVNGKCVFKHFEK